MAALYGCATHGELVAPSDPFAEATALCEALGNSKAYAGRQVLLRGYLTQTPHGREFWDDGCERGFLPLELSPNYPNARRLSSLIAHSKRRPPQVYVVYSGMFADLSPTLVCHGLCSNFVLEGAELVAVRADR